MSSPNKDLLDSVRKYLLAAAAVVTVVFGLFESVLQNSVPPSTSWSKTHYTGLASFSSVLILFLIILIIPRRPKERDKRWLVACALILSAAAFYALFDYHEKLKGFIFDYPPAKVVGSKPEKNLHGDVLTDLGVKLFRSMSKDEAVLACGGLEFVRANQLLWTRESENAVEIRMLKHYVLAVALLNAALFTLLITVHRSDFLATNEKEAPVCE
jgi:hypothetical protein